MSEVVERLLSQGIIKESQVQEMEEFHDLIKESGWLSSAWGSAKPHLKDFGRGVLTSLPAAGLIVGGAHLAKSMDRKDEQTRLTTSLHGLLSSNKGLQLNQAHTVSVFRDIASIAPNVAQNRLVMSRVLPEAVSTGLNAQGISNLVTLEKNLVLSRQGGKAPSMMSDAVRNLSPVLAESATTAVEGYLSKQDFDSYDPTKDGPAKGSTADSSTSAGTSNSEGMKSRLGKNFKESNSSDSTPIDKSQEFQYFYMAAKKARLLPREVSGIDPTDANAVFRWNHWQSKNKAQVQKIMDNLVATYGTEDAFLKAGRESYNSRYGTEKKAEFVGEILADAMFLKTAVAVPTSKPSIMVNALKGLLAASAIGAGFGIVEESADYSRNKTRQKKLVDSWGKAKVILKNMPDNLRTWDGSKETTTRAQGAFNAMISVAPDLAVNPVIAASFINTTLNTQGLIDSNSLKALTDSQKNYTASNNYTSPFAKSPFFSGAAAGFSAAGGKKLIDTAASNLIKEE